MASIRKAANELQKRIEETTDDPDPVERASEEGITKASDSPGGADVLIVDKDVMSPFAPGHDKAAKEAAQADEVVVMSKDEIAELEDRELTRAEKFERLAADPDSSLGFDNRV